MKIVLTLLLFGLTVGLDAQSITQLPYSPSLDMTSMDTSVQPCQDFYKYSCGNWIKKNPLPADQSSWDVYGKLAYDNQRLLWGLLQEAAKPDPNRSAAEQKTGDYYRACMDEEAIEKAGMTPIQADLDRIAAIRSLRDLSLYAAAQYRIGSRVLFGFGSNQDFENSQNVIAFAERGGLGLPDRDYYTKTDAKSVEIRQKYVEHVARMFGLLGEPPSEAKKHADTVMSIETDLAKSMLTRVEMRDPHRLLHKMTPVQFKALAPSFDWDPFFATLGLADFSVVNVTEPGYYTALEAQLKARPVEDWKTLARWKLVNARAEYLSSKFVLADFDFYGRYLRGTPELQPRWRRCVRWVDRDLGEALGQVFVAKTFTPDTKARTVEMTKQIEAAMQSELKDLPWMGDATRQRALEKLHTIVNKIGYPDKWRDYSSLTVKPDDFLGNTARSSTFEVARDVAKIGKPVNRGEWGMSPPTVNAYYDPQMNDINFPAGVLQPPLYDPKEDDAPNYGNTGATIGHELTHGFDDEGRQFDSQGNLKDWWTPKDAEEFQKRVDCVSTQYSQYVVVDDIKINGKLTLGEDVADLGGTFLAYLAWKHATAGQQLDSVQGFTPDQRFFVGMAQWACGDTRPELKRERAITDAHSPLEYRVNGVVANMPEFATAFGCKVGQPMVRKDPCKVW